jgi:N utilization substance protein A
MARLMKTEFMAAITQLSAERRLPKGVILTALESALVSAYKKDSFSPDQEISVKIDPETGGVRVYLQKVVTESVTNPYREISLAEAQNLRGGVQLGEVVEMESTPKNAGRIAAQTAKQVILQRLREAERHATYEDFASKEGEVLTGTIQLVEPKQIRVGLGRIEGILPLDEQVPNERYRIGQRLKFCVLEVVHGARGTQAILSRAHRNLLRRLFELEIPEISNGLVELKAVAREAGYRSKVAVATTQEGIDPVGACIGPRGLRIQSIINELNNEKIDVVQWDSDPKVFIRSSLGPAEVASIEIIENTATVVVPDNQLSLAIGREGQSARLAAKLTNYRIDIKSASTVEAEKTTLESAPAAEAEEASLEQDAVEEPQPVDELPPAESEPQLLEPLVESEEEAPAIAPAYSQVPFEAPEEKPQIRFAEDLVRSAPREQKPSRGKEAKPKSSKAKGKSYREANFQYEVED